MLFLLVFSVPSKQEFKLELLILYQSIKYELE
jgi:hypothetical protein